MNKFYITFAIVLTILFGLFYWDLSPIANTVNTYQNNMTLYLLDMGLDRGKLIGNGIEVTHRYKIIITQACNGMIPILILVSAIVAGKSSWSNKILWGIAGYFIMSTINMLRLFMVIYFVRVPSDFTFYHDILGNLLLMITGIAVFYASYRPGSTI